MRVAGMTVLLVAMLAVAGCSARDDAGPGAPTDDASPEELARYYSEDTAAAARLPRVELELDYAAPEPTLDAALAKADAVVVATVASMRFEAGESLLFSVATLEVRESLKGDLADGAKVAVRAPGGPERLPDGAGGQRVFLTHAPAVPHLFPGDEVLLFLQGDASGDWYYALPWGGQVQIDDGEAVVLPRNPFGGELAGLGVDEVVEKVGALVE